MKHIYFFLIFTAVFCLSVQNGFAQDNPSINYPKQNIEGLSVFPNLWAIMHLPYTLLAVTSLPLRK
ncbi:hypothetical protein JCM19302_3225 [Jejuia pallidilutea]|uniref:Uncharacterized protein n=1 Tax=Jejuia pallidilutea TaxID=504487 RepID=A0A090W709_9FLAO|nr:hypothetical protein JCM19302_3225 [Jejuia pallidilutea]